MPHTHWDREWYAPFQRFRIRLVDLVDDVLARLDADPSYAHFLLDGQMALIDDYLQVRPEAADRIRRLVAAGRLSVGPWYVLMDEFLVSGETIIRDLELGIRRAAALGGAMEVGYLPDMFGHIAQMPQLLAQFGFDHAVVWRGVPAAVNRSAFWWDAPDGSRVRAEYLVGGYGNGAVLPTTGVGLVEQLDTWSRAEESLLADAPILWMNGTDHQMPQAHLGRVIAEARIVAGERYDISVTDLVTYLGSAGVDGLPVHVGELRSGARANLLMGVASNRVDVKQSAARAERALERVAEPLCALFLAPHDWPAALFDIAWLEMIRNAAHDSICACAHDDVVAAVTHRYAEARHIAEGLTERALRAIGQTASGIAPVIVNPSPRPRDGVVELIVSTGAPPPGCQVVTEGPHRDETEGDSTEGAASVVVLAHVGPVPPFGWKTYRPSQLRVPRVEVNTDQTGAVHMTNGLARIEFEPGRATFSIDGHAGLGRLVDGGDAGDTYNYSPPPTDTVVERPETASITVLEVGPVVAQVAMTARYAWPHRVDDARGVRAGTVAADVVTTLELRAGERFARVSVGFVNRCEDHRLRAHFPLVQPAPSSRAECAFTVVERGLIAEGGPTERPLPTFPSRRFVQAGRLTIVHEGLVEYELVDVAAAGARELALTLLRATRYLSRGPMEMRPLPAGPRVELAGSQAQGRHDLRYAIAVGDIDPYLFADEAFTPLLVTYGRGQGTREESGSALTVDGAEVSAVRRVGDGLEVRVYNPTDTPATVRIRGRCGWLVDLRGRPCAPFEERFELGPQRIATARLT